MGLSSFTPRMWLILAHDLLATAAAVVASFYIRFGEEGLAARWWLLVIVLPAFVVYSALVYGWSDLYKAKWRFTSLPDLYNIVRAATVLAATLLALDYVLVAPNIYGTFFFGKITIVLYWLLQIAFLCLLVFALAERKTTAKSGEPVMGLPISDNRMSTAALNLGTPRSDSKTAFASSLRPSASRLTPREFLIRWLPGSILSALSK